jgi:hypothetical protein
MCNMYMSDLRYIQDPVLSSLKMEAIRLLFFISDILLYSTFTCVPTITRVGCSTLHYWCLFEEAHPCFTCIYQRPGSSVGLFSANLTSMFCCLLSSHGFPSVILRPPIWKSYVSLIIKPELSLNVTDLRTRYILNTGCKMKMWNEVQCRGFSLKCSKRIRTHFIPVRDLLIISNLWARYEM